LLTPKLVEPRDIVNARGVSAGTGGPVNLTAVPGCGPSLGAASPWDRPPAARRRHQFRLMAGWLNHKPSGFLNVDAGKIN